MQQLTKSLGTFTWAISVFSVQQVASALGGQRGKGSKQVVESLDEVTKAAIGQCGTAVRETFEIGDKLQRDVIDMMFRMVPVSPDQGAGEMCSCLNCTDAKHRQEDVVRRSSSSQPLPTESDQELGWGPVPPQP